MPKDRNRKSLGKRKSAPVSNIVSIPQLRARAELDGLTGDFVHWAARDLNVDSSVALDLLGRIAHFIDQHAKLTGAPTATVLAVEAILPAVELAEQAETQTATLFAMLDLVDAYLHFLAETGHWSGTEQEFDRVHATVEDGEPVPEGAIVLPEGDDGQAISCFRSMPLVQFARNLLGWIGTGRDVTATGVLKLKDVAQGAAQVGETVRAGKPAVGQAIDESIPLVRSMCDVERLTLIWKSLIVCGMLQVKGSKVLPAEHVPAFLEHATTPEARALLTNFIGIFLISCGEYVFQSYGPMGRHIRGKLMHKLDLALYPEAPEVPVNREDIAELDEYFVHSWLQRYATLGIVRIDSHYRVPLELTRSVDMNSMLVTREEIEASEQTEKFEQFSVALKGTARDSSAAGQVPAMPGSLEGKNLQLRVDLDYAQPPIWRRLVVPASMTLENLHFALQTAFGWNDSHLHHFQQRSADGYRWLQFGDPGMDGELLDERDTRSGQLLSAPRSSLLYDYDYGDSWRLKLVVEKVLDGGTGQAVRCTGGRMRSPVDDIGGIPGWYHAQEVVQDPTHRDHGHLREMLGLEPGQRFDATKFSAETIDGRLARLPR